MVRSLLSIGSLIGIVGWLVFSYLPDEIFSPPKLTMGGQLDFGTTLFILTAAFVTVSALIIRSTWSSLSSVIARGETTAPAEAEEAAFVQQSRERTSNGRKRNAHRPHSKVSMEAPPAHTQHKSDSRLRLSTEIFWTVIPLALTLGVFLLSYYAWTLQ